MLLNVDENTRETEQALRAFVPHVIVTHPQAPQDNLELFALLGAAFGKVPQVAQRAGGLLAGDRAPEAPIMGASGRPTSLFQLFKGPHWTLLGYEVERSAVAPRYGLHIHIFGSRGDVVDHGDYVSQAYALASGSWVLVRPDGYVGAIVSAKEVAALDEYLRNIGLE